MIGDEEEDVNSYWMTLMKLENSVISLMGKGAVSFAALVTTYQTTRCHSKGPRLSYF